MKPQKIKVASWIARTQLHLLNGLLLTTLPFIGIANIKTAQAQPIIPAQDGTNTLVTPNGNEFQINGGTLSSDGANLFHSFQEFGLDANQVANFLSRPDIQNILSRVNGGNPSLINGLIQVTGGNSNLFLMNPSGIIFGTNARLNVPANFTATTATGIGFNNGWFDALNENNYTNLNGNPNQFVFNTLEPGVIINAGDLQLLEGQNLTLMGGSVVNLGTIETPRGQVVLAAVPGENLVRLSFPGELVSLEFALPTDSQGNLIPVTPLMIPQLLAGGLDAQTAEAVSQIPSNSTVVSGEINTVGETGGGIQLLGNRVSVLNANVNASGTNGGGTILIGGDFQGEGVTPTAQETYINPNSNILANAIENGNGGRVIVWSDNATQFSGNIRATGGNVAGNGGFVEVSGKESLGFNGTIDVSAINGISGNILLDPRDIIIEPSDGIPEDNAELSDGAIFFSDGGADTDFVIDDTALTNLTGNITLQSQQDIIAQSGANLNFNNQTSGDTIAFNASRDIAINTPISTAGGSLDFDAENNITTEAITTNGGVIDFNSSSGTIDTRLGTLNTATPTGGGAILLNAFGDIITNNLWTFASSDGNGGNVTLSSGGVIDTTAGQIFAGGEFLGDGGDVNLTASGDILTGDIDTSTLLGSGGAIVLDSGGSINTNTGKGSVILETSTDTLEVPALISISNERDGGNITLRAEGDINAGFIGSAFGEGQGGNVVLESNSGEIDATTTVELDGETARVGAIVSGSEFGNGGNVTLTAPGNITTGVIGSLSLDDGRGGNITINSTGGSVDTTFGAVAGNVSPSLLEDLGLGSGLAQAASSISAQAGIIASGSYLGQGGNVTITAPGNILTGAILSGSLGSGAGGEIFLESGGLIDTTAGLVINGLSEEFLTELEAELVDVEVGSDVIAAIAPAALDLSILYSGSDTGAGGNVTLNAAGDINTGLVVSGSIGSSGGNITLSSATGGIDTTSTLTIDGETRILSALVSASDAGSGGAVNLSAQNNIRTGSIVTGSLDAAGGAVTINSRGGAIDTTAGATINSFDTILLEELGVDPLIAPELSEASVGVGILTLSHLSNGGDVTLTAQGDITTSNIISASINAQGGDIQLTSSNGSINATSGRIFENVTASLLEEIGLDPEYVTFGTYLNDEAIGGFLSLSINGDAGNITLNANNDIATNFLISSSFGGNGGEIRVNSDGNVRIGGIVFNGLNNGLNAANGVMSSLTTVNTDINRAIALTSGGILNSSGVTGNNITVEADGSILTNAVNSSGSSGDGGDITLNADEDIELSTLNSQGGSSGSGGNINVTTEQNFRATETFTDRNSINSSISSAGGTGSGDITIRHGGDGVIPFVVGDAETNGTAGAITSGENNTISPRRAFLGDYEQGNIRILTEDDDLNPIRDEVDPQTQPPVVTTPITQAPTLDNPVEELEQTYTDEYQDYLGLEEVGITEVSDAQEILRNIESLTGVKPALIYARFAPITVTEQQSRILRDPSDRLELVMVTGSGDPIRVQVDATRAETLRAATQLYEAVSDPRSTNYLPPAQQLYQSLIAPIEDQLQLQGIENLLFVMDQGLRLVPVAALHDGNQFLVQKYSAGLSPSLSLTDTSYRDISELSVLAMGSPVFPNAPELDPLPAVSVELPTIAEEIWRGVYAIAEEFTPENLQQLRRETNYGIIHLATHADFKQGSPAESYVQFFNRKLYLDEVDDLNFREPPVELMVLSACRTAYGSETAELGFAGFAVQAGVKSAMASLWYVGDTGTLALMTEFYRQLGDAPIKAEAMRQAQLAMVEGRVRLESNEIISTRGGSIALPPSVEVFAEDLSHPFYWSAFTMVGNPW